MKDYRTIIDHHLNKLFITMRKYTPFDLNRVRRSLVYGSKREPKIILEDLKATINFNFLF